MLRVVPDEELLHFKINNKYVHVFKTFIMVLHKISQKMHAVQESMEGDFTVLN